MKWPARHSQECSDDVPEDAKMTAFEQGWMDAECGLSLRDNPFHRDTGSAIAWRNGWKACYAAHDHNANL